MLGRGGDDILSGGAGLDLMIGGRGGDTYAVDITEGARDLILDMGDAPNISGYYSSGLDVLELTGFGSTSEALQHTTIDISGDDLIFTFANPAGSGPAAQVDIRGHFGGASFAMESIQFAPDGPVYHVALLTGDAYTYSVHSGPDQGGEDLVLGTDAADEIYGGIGNDILWGGDGPDHFMFHNEEDAGGGHDVILDFDVAEDVVDFTDIKDLDASGVTVSATANGDALITTVYGEIELLGVNASALEADNFAYF